MDLIGDNTKYIVWQQNSSDAGVVVEMFLLIAGFFLYISIKKNNTDIFGFVLSKVFRLWPVLFLSIVLDIIINRRFVWSYFLNSFFLQCIGISLEYRGITWYVSPFFWSLVFYYVLLKSIKRKTANVIVPLIVYFSFVININYTGGGFGRETIVYGVSLGLLRCLAGIGLGLMIAKVIDYIQSTRYIDFFRLQNKIIEKIIFSLAEIGSLIFTVRYTVFAKLNYSNKFVFVIMFCILLISFVMKKGIISDIFEVLGKFGLGKYSYSIYVMQQISFYVLRKTLWLNKRVVNHEIICVVVSVAFAVLVGIAVYYLIERPFVKIFKKRMAMIAKT